GQLRLEAIALLEAAPALLGELLHGQLIEAHFPLEAMAASRVLAHDREGVVGTEAHGADLEHRVEAVALEHLAPVEALIAQRIRPVLDGLEPAARQDLVELPAALGQASVGQDVQLLDLEPANRTAQAGWT